MAHLGGHHSESEIRNLESLLDHLDSMEIIFHVDDQSYAIRYDSPSKEVLLAGYPELSSAEEDARRLRAIALLDYFGAK